MQSRGLRLRSLRRFDWMLGLLVAAAIASLAYTDQMTVSIVQLLRLGQGIVLYLYLRYWAWRHFDADRTAVAFLVGALLQATLGISQYVLQHDVGLRWLGEPLVRTDMRGVALFYNEHFTKVLRAYGTFPHPNVFAAYLAVALGTVSWLWMRHGARGARHGWAWPTATAMLLWALYLTYSRTVIAVTAMGAVTVGAALFLPRISNRWANIRIIRARARELMLTVLAASVLFVALLWPTIVARMTISASDEAVRLRIKYSANAIATGDHSALHINWTGVGIGNFTTWLSKYDPSVPSFMYQPAHNLYLLIYSEMGVFGMVAWAVWLALALRRGWRARANEPLLRWGMFVLIGMFLAIGLFDHFFWTLQQGRLLWWFALALMVG
jgi:O-antigen ligase